MSDAASDATPDEEDDDDGKSDFQEQDKAAPRVVVGVALHVLCPAQLGLLTRNPGLDEAVVFQSRWLGRKSGGVVPVPLNPERLVSEVSACKGDCLIIVLYCDYGGALDFLKAGVNRARVSLAALVLCPREATCRWANVSQYYELLHHYQRDYEDVVTYLAQQSATVTKSGAYCELMS